MAECFLVKNGGGTSLNFDVKAYDTEEALMAATPKENTIGIITTTPITSWIFSATEPKIPADGKDGLVWFTVGTTSNVSFNALRKNTIQVYPISARQYVSGAWVDKETKSVKNGEWSDWIKYLYNNGDECVSITGGWVNERQAPTDNLSYYPVEKRNGSMYVKTVYGYVSHFVTANAIDLSNVKKIIVDTPILAFTGSTFCDAAVSILSTRNSIDSKVAETRVSTSANSIVVDLSGIQTGEYFVAISTGYDVEIEITSIRME